MRGTQGAAGVLLLMEERVRSALDTNKGKG